MRALGRWIVRILGVGSVGLLLIAALSVGTSYAAVGPITPALQNDLDCNGWSNSYLPARPAMKSLCTDPIQINANGKASRLIDNGWYVGHDEPSVKFISSAPGSGNTMTYYMQIPHDPAATPTPSGSVTDYAELSLAPWFGLPICDPHSYPQNPCKPDSDRNQSQIDNPAGAGSAFMELQFYPPGYTPFIDSVSCSTTQWCAALNIDSLECTYGFASCNNNCIEPVNFAYLQTDGVPAGSPAPQTPDAGTWFGNAKTLRMNAGDVVEVSISDPSGGFLTRVVDLTTGHSGFMQASASNGFANTNIADCSGNPFTFHAEYNTARQQNQVPWAALEGGVLMEQEIGHSEACDSVTEQLGFSTPFFNDPNIYQLCRGGSEGPAGTRGEGPCDPASGKCTGAETQGTTGPASCPTHNADTGALCEFADANCTTAGLRTAYLNGSQVSEMSPSPLCLANWFQNGDLDFDGLAYHADWPNGSPNYPQTFRYSGPFTNGKPYPAIQFETDSAGSQNLCNPSTGAGCAAPPISAAFYPFWSTALTKSPLPSGGNCVWNFGNDIAGVTSDDFGAARQYGTPDVVRYGGTLASNVLVNPTLSRSCT